MAKSATFSGSVTIAKALASLEKTNEKTVRQASDFYTSVEKVKKLIEMKSGVSGMLLTTLVSLLQKSKGFLALVEVLKKVKELVKEKKLD